MASIFSTKRRTSRTRRKTVKGTAAETARQPLSLKDIKINKSGTMSTSYRAILESSTAKNQIEALRDMDVDISQTNHKAVPAG